MAHSHRHRPNTQPTPPADYEHTLDPHTRHRHGAHYTAEPDILRVIGPTIVDPWRVRIAAATRETLPALATALENFHVLDPACGTGNFLLVARRELLALAAALLDRARELGLPAPPLNISSHQLHGIDRDPDAAAIARQRLPGADIRTGDALLDPWPRPVGELAIVGNPPYLGVRKLRRALGDEHVTRLFARYPHNRAADLATYWFTRASEHLRPGERAGYVCTNAVARNTNRAASLDRILAAGGTITDAWPSYPWPGDAVVHVSIINWISGPHPGPAHLAGRPVPAISSHLRPLSDPTPPATSDASPPPQPPPLRAPSHHPQRLPGNAGLAFMGVTPGASGFVLDPASAQTLRARDPASAAILVPFLIGRDISRDPEQRPSRFILDFATRTLADAREHPGALAHVRRHVLPQRRVNPREAAMPRWWQFWRPAPALRRALATTRRVLVIPSLAPHLLVSRQPSNLCFDHQLIVITLADPYHLGVLQSRLHAVWARAHGSTLKTDLRYTPSTVFETFPFPPPPHGHADPRQRPRSELADRVATCATTFDRLRRAACRKHDLGLTRLHNHLEQALAGAPLDLTPLRAAFTALNDAVTACYGLPPGLWRDDDALLTALLALNARLAASAPAPAPAARPTRAAPSPPAPGRAAAAGPRRSRGPRR